MRESTNEFLVDPVVQQQRVKKMEACTLNANSRRKNARKGRLGGGGVKNSISDPETADEGNNQKKKTVQSQKEKKRKKGTIMIT